MLFRKKEEERINELESELRRQSKETRKHEDLAWYNKRLEEYEEFKKVPFKYDVGLKVLNYVVVDRSKIIRKSIPETFHIIGCFAFFYDSYRVINVITGEAKDATESTIDEWVTADGLIRKTQ